MVLLSVFDKKAETFGGVISQVNVAVAVRDFSSACQDSNTNLNRFPEDYSLYLVGDFDQETGNIVVKTPVEIAKASSFVQKKEA